MAIELLELERKESLKKMWPELLIFIACNNAVDVYKRLKDKFAHDLKRLNEELRAAEALLTLTARKRHDELLVLLLEAGIAPQQATTNKENVLNYVCKYGSVKTVEILFTKKATVAVNWRGQRRDPLFVAVEDGRLDLVQFLLEEKVSGRVRDKQTFEIEGLKEGKNAFHLAVALGQMEIAQLLLSKSPRLRDVKTRDGRTPLQEAVVNKEFRMCQFLKEKGVDPGTLRSFPQQDQKISDDYFDYLLMLQDDDVDARDGRGKTPLRCAIQHHELDLARELVQSGANIEATDENGWNAVHSVCHQLNLSGYIRVRGYLDVLRLMHVKNSRLASQKTKCGQTALHVLFKSQRHVEYSIDVVRFLVEEAGVDVNAEDDQGRVALKIDECTPRSIRKCLEHATQEGKLHLAAKRGDFELVRQLVESGADLGATDYKTRTTLMLACKSNNAKVVQYLLAKGADLEACDERGRTALMFACQWNKVDAVQLLLSNDANLKRKDKEGENALHYALHSLKLVQMLHKRNPNLVKERTKEGNNALHLAADDANGCVEVIRWLVIQIGIGVHARNKRGQTALELAAKSGLCDAMEFLFDMGAEYKPEDNEHRSVVNESITYTLSMHSLRILLERGVRWKFCAEELHYRNYDLDFLKIMNDHSAETFKIMEDGADVVLHRLIFNGSCNRSFTDLKWLVEDVKDDLQVRDCQGKTPLFIACELGRWEVVDLLLGKNVKLNAKDKKGKTAFDYVPFCFLK